MLEVIEGQPIGTHGLIVVKELPPKIHPKYKERQVEVICPVCGKYFVSDLRRLTRKDKVGRRAVSMCPDCSAKNVAEQNKIRGVSYIDDLSGQRFGYLIALYPLETRKRHSVVWHCKCDCGGEKDVIQVDLKRGHTTHCDKCGKHIGFGESKDLTNQHFGKLTALYPTQMRSSGSVVWYCLCDCGNYCYKSCDSLTKGHSQSCGCLISKGEALLQSLFMEMGINYQTQKSFNDCINPKTGAKLKFDFYLPDYNCCVEYDGIQHFKYEGIGWDSEKEFYNRQFRDKIKDVYCKLHNIYLIRIPYWDFSDIDKDYLLDRFNRLF